MAKFRLIDYRLFRDGDVAFLGSIAKCPICGERGAVYGAAHVHIIEVIRYDSDKLRAVYIRQFCNDTGPHNASMHVQI